MVLSVVIPTFVVVSADIASSKQAGLNHLYFPRFPEGMRKTVLVGVEQVCLALQHITLGLDGFFSLDHR